MGKKGAKLTEEATVISEQLIEFLESIGGIARKKMFGGYGVFHKGKMFALVNSDAVVHFKVSEVNEQRYNDAGVRQDGRMPYRAVPKLVLRDQELLIDWAKVSIKVAHDT